MTTYTLTTPVTVGSLTSPITLSQLQITGITYSSTPPLAPIGSGLLAITLTDPVSGWQEAINYLDATVPPMWTQSITVAEEELGDVIAGVVFAKLMADGKLPAGTVSVS